MRNPAPDRTRSAAGFLAAAALAATAFLVGTGAANVPPGADAAARVLVRAPDAGDPRERGVLPCARADSAILLVYGDNRPALRTIVHSRSYRWLRDRAPDGPGLVPLALLVSPLLLAESIVPTLDGPRDLVTLFTNQPTAGEERSVLAALRSAGPADAIISTGDLVKDGRHAKQWMRFERLHADVRRTTPYLAAPGNHERMDTEAGRAHWDAAMGAPPRPRRYWYTVDLPEQLARFVFLDGNLLVDHEVPGDVLGAGLAAEQLAWADSALNSPFRHRFVVIHQPPVCAGYHENDWETPEAMARRARLLELCARRNVTAILAGHEHLYHRAWLRNGASGVWNVTTGGGGSPLHTVRDAREVADASARASGFELDEPSQFARSTHHYCRLAIPRAGGAPVLTAFEVRRGAPTRELDRLVLQPPGGTR